MVPKERCVGESPKLVAVYGNACGGDRSLDFRVSQIEEIFVVSFFKRRLEKYNSKKRDVACLGFCDLRTCQWWVGEVDVQQRDNGGQICDKKHGRFWSKLDRERLETITEFGIENIYS